MTGSGEPILPRPFLIPRRQRTALQCYQLPLPLFRSPSLRIKAGQARPVQSSLRSTAGHYVDTCSSSPTAGCRVVSSASPRRDVCSSLRGASRCSARSLASGPFAEALAGQEIPRKASTACLESWGLGLALDRHPEPRQPAKGSTECWAARRPDGTNDASSTRLPSP